MANYTTANLVKAQTILTNQFNAGEVRFRNPVTFLEFIRNTEIMVPSHNQVRTRNDRTVETNYFLRSARSLGTGGILHNHTGVKGDSSVLTPSWTTYDDKFYNSLKQADISVYTLEQQIANELRNVVGNFAEGLETVAANYLANNRVTANSYAAQGTFDATDDVFDITESSEGDRAIQITKTVMDFNKFQGIPYIIFCDTVAFDKFEKQANQGSANSSNLSFQFSNARFIKSIDLDTVAAALSVPRTKGFWIAVPEGMISCLDWIPVQNRNGVVTKENMYGTFINPVDGLTYGTHSYEERVDDTAANGYAQDVKTETQIFIDISLQHAPLATQTPIYAFALV